MASITAEIAVVLPVPAYPLTTRMSESSGYLVWEVFPETPVEKTAAVHYLLLLLKTIITTARTG